MRWRRKKRQSTERPQVEESQRNLEAIRAQRPRVEREAAGLRWHLKENDFRNRVLGLVTGEDR